MMTEIKHYKDMEKVFEDGNLGPREAARCFVELATDHQHPKSDQDLDNLAELLRRLGTINGFYTELKREIDHTDPERIPPNTRILLYSL